MRKSTRFVAMDINKDSITVALAENGRMPVLYVTIDSTGAAVTQLAGKLSESGTALRFCYEAGPCGYGVYRQLRVLGHACAVVAPSLIPRRPGDRIKTDRCDALFLARLHQHGELTSVWVLDEEQEAIRDLDRAREDFKHTERRVRQRLGGFLLRHGRVYTGGQCWTQAHLCWLETQHFAHPVQQIVFQEYVDEVKHARRRIKSLEEELEKTLSDWIFAGEAWDLMALRGVVTLSAITVPGRTGRYDALQQAPAAYGLCRSGAQRALQRTATTAGRDHQGGQRARAAGPGEIVLVLSLPGAQDQAPAARCRLSLGKRRKGSAHATGAFRRAACPRARSARPWAIARELLGFTWAIAWERRHRGSMIVRAAA